MHVVRGAGETACASAVVDGGDFRGGDEEGPGVGVVAGPGLGAFGRHGFLVHVGQLVAHLGGGEHGGVMWAEGGEDVGLEVFI